MMTARGPARQCGLAIRRPETRRAGSYQWFDDADWGIGTGHSGRHDAIGAAFGADVGPESPQSETWLATTPVVAIPMRIAARIILTLACLCVLTQQTGCVQAHQVRFRNHLDASVQPSKVNHSVIVVADR